MSIYDSIKNSIRPVIYTGLAVLTLTGCGDSGLNKEKKTMDADLSKTYFTEWGFVDKIKMDYSTDGGNQDDLEISLGDMDNDGDLDIVVGSRVTGLTIYENRIPQKKE